MKLFITNKKIQEILENSIKPYKDENYNLNKKISALLNECESLEKANIELNQKLNDTKEELIKVKKENKTIETIVTEREKFICGLEEENKTLKIKNKKANSSAGGFIKQINKLQAKLDEASTLLSQRYILKTVIADKSKGHQKMQLYANSNSKKSQIIKKVVEDE